MRRLIPAAIFALAFSSCTSFRPVERGDWLRVYANAEGEHGAGAPQDVITRDQEAAERTGGVARAWKPPQGFEAPLLADTRALALKVGEVQQFRIDEPGEPRLLQQGSAVELFWNEAEKRDEWKNGTDVTHRESVVFVKARKEGTSTLRLMVGETPKDTVVTVKP